MEIESQINPQHSKEKIRLGVLTFYLCQGLCFATWASRIPDIKEYFNVSDDFMWGIILFMIPIGKILAIPLAGYTVSKLGSKAMVQVAILGYALTLFTIGIATNTYIFGACLVLFGLFWNLTDISLNTQGIDIERLYGKTIMGSFHGAWSLAACVGALIGFLMINLNINVFTHFSIVVVLIIASWLINRKYLQKDTVVTSNEQSDEKKESIFHYLKKPEIILIQLGFIGLCALFTESAMFDWGGVYFQSIVKAPKSLQIGFLVFMVMMTVGRFIMDKAYTWLGKKKTVQAAGALIFAGMFISAIFPNVLLCSIGFMMVGLGISWMVPTIYSVVGEKSKTPTSIALTLLSTISTIGSVIAPLLIGYVSKSLNMNYAYMVVGILGLFILILSTCTNAMSEKK
jgi:MFS family permease